MVRDVPPLSGYVATASSPRFALPQILIACGAGFCTPFLLLNFKDRFGLARAWGNLLAGGQVMTSISYQASHLGLSRRGFVRSIVAI